MVSDRLKVGWKAFNLKKKNYIFLTRFDIFYVRLALYFKIGLSVDNFFPRRFFLVIWEQNQIQKIRSPTYEFLPWFPWFVSQSIVSSLTELSHTQIVRHRPLIPLECQNFWSQQQFFNKNCISFYDHYFQYNS